MIDHLLDLDVLMAVHEKKMGPVLPNPLVLGKRQGEALETATRRTLTDELERSVPAEVAREAADVLVQHPEQRLVLGEALLAIFIHGHSVRQSSGSPEKPSLPLLDA